MLSQGLPQPPALSSISSILCHLYKRHADHASFDRNQEPFRFSNKEAVPGSKNGQVGSCNNTGSFISTRVMIFSLIDQPCSMSFQGKLLLHRVTDPILIRYPLDVNHNHDTAPLAEALSIQLGIQAWSSSNPFSADYHPWPITNSVAMTCRCL